MATNYDYDSAAAREAARKIKKSAQALKEGAQGKLNTLCGEIPDNFEGDAAKALSDRATALNADVKSITGSLAALAKALEKYADDLDEAAAKLAAKL